jgi:hypothetical protein
MRLAAASQGILIERVRLKDEGGGVDRFFPLTQGKVKRAYCFPTIRIERIDRKEAVEEQQRFVIATLGVQHVRTLCDEVVMP